MTNSLSESGRLAQTNPISHNHSERSHPCAHGHNTPRQKHAADGPDGKTSPPKAKHIRHTPAKKNAYQIARPRASWAKPHVAILCDHKFALLASLARQETEPRRSAVLREWQ